MPHTLGKGGIPLDLLRQPHPLSPRFEPMIGQHLADTLDADVADKVVPDQLASDLLTVPLGERPRAGVGSLTGDLDYVQGHLWGKTRACALVPADRTSPPSDAV